MSKSLVLSMEVLYKTSINLKAIITFYLPDNSELVNPDGTKNYDFRESSNGPAGHPNNVIMDFIEQEASGGASTKYKAIVREGIITLNDPFNDTQETTSKLYLKKVSGTPESEKSQTGDDYIADPNFHGGD